MPDIAMCRDQQCPQRGTCYRHRAVPSGHRQAYFSKSPRVGDQCHDYIPVTPGDATNAVHELRRVVADMTALSDTAVFWRRTANIFLASAGVHVVAAIVWLVGTVLR